MNAQRKRWLWNVNDGRKEAQYLEAMESIKLANWSYKTSVVFSSSMSVDVLEQLIIDGYNAIYNKIRKTVTITW